MNAQQEIKVLSMLVTERNDARLTYEKAESELTAFLKLADKQLAEERSKLPVALPLTPATQRHD